MVDPAGWRDRCVVAYLDEPPYFQPVAGSDPTGSDIELVTMVLGALGVERIDFELTTFGELIDGLLARRWHVNTPMFVTERRSELIRFSCPVWAAIDGFIVRSDDDRDLSSYESIASDETVRLAAVTGQVQLDAALAAGVPSTRIVEFGDQHEAALAVLAGVADASASTAPGNAAFLDRLDDDRLISIPDAGAAARADVPLGAFSFHPDSRGLADAFDVQLRRTLGTPAHLEMMARYGFDEAALRPALDAAN